MHPRSTLQQPKTQLPYTPKPAPFLLSSWYTILPRHSHLLLPFSNHVLLQFFRPRAPLHPCTAVTITGRWLAENSPLTQLLHQPFTHQPTRNSRNCSSTRTRGRESSNGEDGCCHSASSPRLHTAPPITHQLPFIPRV